MEMNFEVKLRNRRKHGVNESVNNGVGNNRDTSDIEFIKTAYNGNLTIQTLSYSRISFHKKKRVFRV